MKTSSCGFEAFTSASAAAATLARLSRMLPLLSIMMPIETGTSSRRKILMGCSTPFSKTLKADSGRSVTRWPFLSITLTCRSTSWIPPWNTGVSSGPSAGLTAFCPRAIFAHRLRPAPPTNAKISRLLCRRIITWAMIGPELRQSRRFHQFHLNPSKLSVPLAILWMISDHVLIAQFQTDLGRDIRQIAQVVAGEKPAPGRFRELVQQPRPARFLRRAIPPGQRFEDADGINLYIGLPHGVLHLALGIPAGVISAVRDDQDRFARVSGLFHLVHGHIDAIQERRSSFGFQEGQAILDVFGNGREGDQQLRPVIELDQEKFIFGIGGLQELRDGFAGPAQFRAHAPAGVKNHTHGHRRILA